MLSQIQNGKEVVISYASKNLTPTQQRYATVEKEAAAVDFEDLENSKLGRWSMRLSALNYTIKYRPGRVHENADFLSRIALVSEGDDLTKSIREQQASDNICKAIIDYLDKGILTHENPIPIWAKEIDFFFIQNGILCRSNPPT